MADCVCNVGYTGTNTSCEACEAHSNSQGDQTDCTCNKGYGYVFTDGVGESCVQCAAGTYKHKQENQKCSDCNENEFSSALGATTNECQPCPANSKSPQQSTSQFDCVCNQGYMQVIDALENVMCSKCPQNSGSLQGAACFCNAGFKGNNNDHTCTDCVPGKYKTQDSSTCVQCANGTFSGASAATSAESCVNCQVAGGDICESCECRSDRDTLPVGWLHRYMRRVAAQIL